MSEFRRRNVIDLHVDFMLSEPMDRLRREGPTPEAMDALFRTLTGA